MRRPPRKENLCRALFFWNYQNGQKSSFVNNAPGISSVIWALFLLNWYLLSYFRSTLWNKYKLWKLQPITKQVKHALEQPFHKGIPRYEAYCYISMYEEDECNNKLLLRLAKLDYHLSQMLNKQDLCEILRCFLGRTIFLTNRVCYEYYLQKFI